MIVMSKKYTPHPDDIRARVAIAKMPVILEHVYLQIEAMKKYREQKHNEAANLRAGSIRISKDNAT